MEQGILRVCPPQRFVRTGLCKHGRPTFPHARSGAYGGLRASGKKGDLSLVVCDTDATVGGTFTLNVMCAAPVLYCKDVLARKKTTRAVSSPCGYPTS